MKTNSKKKKIKTPRHKKKKKTPQKYRLGKISNTKLLAGLNRFYRRLTSHPVNKVYMGGDNLRLSVNCLYGYVLENFELSHR